jgi:hypothetical protein
MLIEKQVAFFMLYLLHRIIKMAIKWQTGKGLKLRNTLQIEIIAKTHTNHHIRRATRAHHRRRLCLCVTLSATRDSVADSAAAIHRCAQISNTTESHS